MTKAELIAQVAAETGLTKAGAQQVVETLVKAASKTLKREGRFALHDIGVFEVVKRNKRKGRNPQTGEPVTIKAHKAVKFKASKSLKDSIN